MKALAKIDKNTATIFPTRSQFIQFIKYLRENITSSLGDALEIHKSLIHDGLTFNIFKFRCKYTNESFCVLEDLYVNVLAKAELLGAKINLQDKS